MLAETNLPLRRRVLIVDDNHDLAESLKSLLEYYGCLVDVAHDGHDGLSKAILTRPDVVFIDIAMPGMSGYEVARAIRSALPYEVVLIAQTAYGSPEAVAESMSSGFNEHLVKPAEPDCLIRKVADAPSFFS